MHVESIEITGHSRIPEMSVYVHDRTRSTMLLIGSWLMRRFVYDAVRTAVWRQIDPTMKGCKAVLDGYGRVSELLGASVTVVFDKSGRCTSSPDAVILPNAASVGKTSVVTWMHRLLLPSREWDSEDVIIANYVSLMATQSQPDVSALFLEPELNDRQFRESLQSRAVGQAILICGERPVGFSID
jgi:hypothetical protein